MAYQQTFRRWELKYLLSIQQQQAVLQAMSEYMTPDRYGHTFIRNLYYDTENYRLIRRSIEKPRYKEKLRLRSYSLAGENSPVFVELKKKYNGLVYKRRLSLPYGDALSWLAGDPSLAPDSQIGREIEAFRLYYQTLRPEVYLSYRRQAWYHPERPDFRVTFDDSIQFRRQQLSLSAPPGGTLLLPEDTVLMEIKTAGGIPLWMTSVLTQNRLFKTSFSKYGTAYQNFIFPNIKECTDHV